MPHRITLLKLMLIAIAISFLSSQSFAQDSEATDEPPELVPLTTVQGDGVTLELYFTTIMQGRAGLLGLKGDNITEAQASIFSRQFEFYPVRDKSGLYTFVVARMDQPIRVYELVVSVLQEGSTEPQILRGRINVVNGRFIQQAVVLPPEDELLALLDPQIEADELAFVFNRATISEDVLWDEGGFVPPINSELTSPFGAVRVFNETLDSIHTGWDFKAEIGDLMVASATGKVAFAGAMPLRGNYVLVDHGQGIYSGYAHLSVSYVTQGQRIQQGQVVGRVGSTGRSSSAHAHIEFIIQGEWVDAADFIRLTVP